MKRRQRRIQRVERGRLPSFFFFFTLSLRFPPFSASVSIPLRPESPLDILSVGIHTLPFSFSPLSVSSTLAFVDHHQEYRRSNTSSDYTQVIIVTIPMFQCSNVPMFQWRKRTERRKTEYLHRTQPGLIVVEATAVTDVCSLNRSSQ